MIDRHAALGPCILLDAALTVVHVGTAAQRLLEDSAPTLSLRQHRLDAGADAAALNRCLALAARGSRSAICLPRAGRPALTLRAEPLPAGTGARVRVALRDPELEVPDPALLQGLFGLTPTEAVVAAGLAEGMNSAELALSLGVQPNTVQSHIKRTLLKSGARRQSQLVSLILRSVAMPLHPWVTGPGLAQTGNDIRAHARHSHRRHGGAPCGCP